MRAVSVFAVLSAICGLAAIAVHAQTYIGGGESPRLLADGSDNFGASRKMLGSTYYTGTGTSGDKSRDSTAPPFAGSATNSAAAANPASSSQNNPQTIYPSATAQPPAEVMTALPAASKSTPSSSESGDAPGGLRSLQQRLSAIRKGGPSAATSSNVRSPVVEAPPLMNQSASLSPRADTPVVAAPTPASVAAGTGPKDGPTPPGMPDIRAAQLPRTGIPTRSDPPADGAPISLNGNDTAASTTIAGSSSGPVVSGPVGSVRRAPTVMAPVVQSDSTGSEPVARPSATTLAGGDNSFARQSPVIGAEVSGPRSITIGREATFSVIVSNAGEVPAQEIAVAVKIPEWTELVGTKMTSGAASPVLEQRGEPLLWRIPRVEARGKEQLTLRLVPHESKPFDLPVQWTCSPGASQALVEVKEPKLAMTLDGPTEVVYGQTKVYRLTLTNPGTGDADNVVLFLAPVDGSSAPPTRHEVGTLRAGENKPIEVELSARQAGTLSVKAVAVAEGQLRAEVAEEILVRRAGLKAVISGPEQKFAGTPTTYTIVVSNPGNAPAENVALAAMLPPGAKFVSSASGQYVDGENKVVWTLPTLRPGVEQEVEFRCSMTSPGANRVQVLANARADLADSMTLTTTIEALADLKLDVVDPPGPLSVGEELTYEVHVRNRGTKAAENVEVAGFFSNGVEPISAQGGQHEIAPGQVTFKPIAAIAAGAEAVLKIKARADEAGSHVFRAEVVCQAMGAKLASEQATMFYGDGKAATRTAARPAPMPSVLVPSNPSSAGQSPTPAIVR